MQADWFELLEILFCHYFYKNDLFEVLWWQNLEQKYSTTNFKFLYFLFIFFLFENVFIYFI